MEGRCFVTSDRTAEAEGDYRVTAVLGDLEARADVQVRSVDLSGLIAVRQRAPSDGSAAPAPAASEAAAGVASVTSREGGGWLLAVGLMVLGATLACALLAVRVRRNAAAAARSHDAKASPARHAVAAMHTAVTVAEIVLTAGAPSGAAPPQAVATTPGGLLTCRSCGLAGKGAERFCAKHGIPLVPADQNPLRAAGMICPTCRRGHPPDAEFCPHDRTALVPYALFGRVDGPKNPNILPRICPVCGERFGPHVTFCGKDGAALSPVN
jgi:hypothetical protein